MSYKLHALNDLPSAYWRFEETTGTTAADSSGFGRSLTYPVAPSLNQPGLVPGSRSALFSGNAHATTTINNLLVRGREDQSFAMEVWIKADRPTDHRLVMGRTDAGIFITPNGVEFSVRQVNGEIKTAYFTVVDWNSSMHVVANLAGRNITILVDGFKGVSDRLYDHVANTSTTFYIGGNGVSSTSSVYIDEAALYANPLSFGRINRHISSGSLASDPLSVSQLFAGTYYSMSDASADIAEKIVEEREEELSSGTLTGDLTIDDGLLVGHDGSKTSLLHWIGDAGIVDGSRISYDASAGVVLEVSLDRGASWARVANNSEIPGITKNTDVTDKFIQYRALFTSDPNKMLLSGSDSTSLSLSEGSAPPEVYMDIVSADATSLSAVEGTSVNSYNVIGGSDTTSLSLTEARSFSTVTTSGSESVTLSTAEAQTLTAGLSNTDSPTLSIAEGNTLDTGHATADSIALSLSESGSFSVVSVNGTDSSALSLVEGSGFADSPVTASDNTNLSIAESSSFGVISLSASDSASLSVPETAAIATDRYNIDAVDSGSLSIADTSSIVASTSITDVSAADAGSLSSTESTEMYVAGQYDQGYDREYAPPLIAGGTMMMGSMLTEQPRTLSDEFLPAALGRVSITIYKKRNVKANLAQLDAEAFGPVVLAELPFTPALNRQDMGATLASPAYLKVPAQPLPTRTIDFWYKRNQVATTSSYIFDARDAVATGNPYLWFDATNVLGFATGQTFYINGQSKTPTSADFPVGTWVHVTAIFPGEVATPIFLNARYTENEQGFSSIAHFSAHPNPFSARDALVNYQMQTGLVLHQITEPTVPAISEKSAIAYKSRWTVVGAPA